MNLEQHWQKEIKWENEIKFVSQKKGKAMPSAE